MSNYQKVIDAINENNLKWEDIDRIQLNPETYADFQERSSFNKIKSENHPAIRKTNEEECIKYVSKNGMMVTIELQ